MLNNILHVDIYQQRYKKLSFNAKDKINTVTNSTMEKNTYIAISLIKEGI